MMKGKSFGIISSMFICLYTSLLVYIYLCTDYNNKNYNSSWKDVFLNRSLITMPPRFNQFTNTNSSNKFIQYYYLHIPKTGGYGMQGDLSENGAWVYNTGKGPWLEDMQRRFYNKYPDHRVFMSEGRGFDEYTLPHSLVMFRNPMNHVVSMYFHCMEAISRKEKYKSSINVTLDEFLEHFVRIQNSNPLKPRYFPNQNETYWRDYTFKCFVPINTQSYFVGWWKGTSFGSKAILQHKFEIIGKFEVLYNSLPFFHFKVYWNDMTKVNV